MKLLCRMQQKPHVQSASSSSESAAVLVLLLLLPLGIFLSIGDAFIEMPESAVRPNSELGAGPGDKETKKMQVDVHGNVNLVHGHFERGKGKGSRFYPFVLPLLLEILGVKEKT